MYKDIFSREKIERIKTTLLFVFSFCLPLFQKLSTITLVLLIVVSLFDEKDRSKYKNIAFLLPIILYILIAISIFNGSELEFKYLEQRASLIVIPIIFFAKSINEEILLKVLKYFVQGCFLGVLICFVNSINNSLLLEDGDWVFQPVVNKEFSFFYSVVRDGNYFFSSFFSIFHETIYYAIYINTAIAIILSLQLWKRNMLYICVLLVFTLTIFQLSSKIGIITCFVIYCIYALLRLRKKRWKFLFIIFIAMLGVISFKYNPRGKVMVDKLIQNGIVIDPSERFGYQLRLMSWDSAIDIIKENPVLGVGVNNTQPQLNKQYEFKGYKMPFTNRFNAHNQFLQIYLEIGILGVLGIFLMLYILIKKFHTSNIMFFKISFLVILFLSFLFESVLNRYSGISYITFFYCVIISHKKMQKKQ